MNATRVLHAEDDDAFATAVGTLLSHELRIAIVGRARDGQKRSSSPVRSGPRSP